MQINSVYIENPGRVIIKRFSKKKKKKKKKKKNVNIDAWVTARKDMRNYRICYSTTALYT